MIRLLFFFLFLAGAGLAFIYPMVGDRVVARDMGRWTVYDPATGFKPVTVKLAPENAPLQVFVDLTAARQTNQSTAAILTLTVDSGNGTVLARPLAFPGAPFREGSPQDPVKTYREQAGTIKSVEPGDYVFTVGEGDAEGVRIVSVDLVLTGGSATDPRAVPIGYALMAIGFIGFVLSFRRRGPRNPNEQPPAQPRWGRDGGSQS